VAALHLTCASVLVVAATPTPRQPSTCHPLGCSPGRKRKKGSAQIRFCRSKSNPEILFLLGSWIVAAEVRRRQQPALAARSFCLVRVPVV
jgi:hypothetical protein